MKGNTHASGVGNSKNSGISISRDQFSRLRIIYLNEHFWAALKSRHGSLEVI
jgi:hypothetical protein